MLGNLILKKTIGNELKNKKLIELKGNRIFCEDKDKFEELTVKENVNIKYYGVNSTIVFNKKTSIKNLNLHVGDGCYLYFGENFSVRHSFTIDARARNTTIWFSKNANVGTGTIYAGDSDNLEVIIGDNFLSAIGLMIRVSDGHPIYDLKTNELINESKFGVHIGNNVWCGANVCITKDVIVPDMVVIGMSALVCKSNFLSNSIIAGVPAKTIKTDIKWQNH